MKPPASGSHFKSLWYSLTLHYIDHLSLKLGPPSSTPQSHLFAGTYAGARWSFNLPNSRKQRVSDRLVLFVFFFRLWNKWKHLIGTIDQDEASSISSISTFFRGYAACLRNFLFQRWAHPLQALHKNTKLFTQTWKISNMTLVYRDAFCSQAIIRYILRAT